MAASILFLALLALTSSLAIASDPSPLQDFCVADKTTSVFVNGLVCKNPKLVKADDFFRFGINKPASTSNPIGAAVTQFNVDQIPGLNTLGITMARIDFAPYGLIPPHYHPRASEILTVLEGSLYVGFVASNSKLFTKVLNKGDVFIFPQGLIHFQYNPGHKNAVSISALGSQNPGAVFVANTVFGSQPAISDDVLSKAFQLDKKTVDWLQAQFSQGNN